MLFKEHFQLCPHNFSALMKHASEETVNHIEQLRIVSTGLIEITVYSESSSSFRYQTQPQQFVVFLGEKQFFQESIPRCPGFRNLGIDSWKQIGDRVFGVNTYNKTPIKRNIAHSSTTLETKDVMAGA